MNPGTYPVGVSLCLKGSAQLMGTEVIAEEVLAALYQAVEILNHLKQVTQLPISCSVDQLH